MKFDFSFDQRIAGQYARQRRHPPQVSRQIGRAIAAQAGPNAHLLEIGVGNGRIAGPIAAAGCRVVGLDISGPMLRQAARSHLTPTLLQANMQHLPLPGNYFDAVVAVHVLHLAKNWQQVLQEAARTLQPTGVFIQGDDWTDPHSVVGRLRDELRRLALAHTPQTRPPAAAVNKQQFLNTLSGTAPDVSPTETIVAQWTTWVSPAERLKTIKNRMDPESWMLPDSVFEPLFWQLKDFAANTWPNPTKKQPVTHRFLLKTTRGKWL